jgi:hypothetical protein
MAAASAHGLAVWKLAFATLAAVGARVRLSGQDLSAEHSAIAMPCCTRGERTPVHALSESAPAASAGGDLQQSGLRQACSVLSTVTASIPGRACGVRRSSEISERCADDVDQPLLPPKTSGAA